MKIIIIDNEYKFKESAGASGLSDIRSTCSMLVEEQEINVLQGLDRVDDFLSMKPKQILNQDNIIFLIHESFGLDWYGARKVTERESVAQVCERIRGINPRARVVIFGFASEIALPSFVTEAEADAFFSGSGQQSFEALEELLFRGPVSDEEIQQRGKTIEMVCEGKRVAGGTGWVERSIVKRATGNKEGD